jgi:hypothetical protein
VKVFIQKSEDGLFLKADGVWVSEKEAAKDFVNCTPAIDYCVEHKIKDVRLLLSFGDNQYDLPMEIFRAETRTLVKTNRELRARKEALLRQIDVRQAKAKERKKVIPFNRKGVKDPQRSSRERK